MITIDEFIEQNKNCLKGGWIAMDINRKWNWFKTKPKVYCNSANWMDKGWSRQELYMFDIYPVDDFLKSLRKVG